VAKAETSVANIEAGGFASKIGAWPARLKEYFGELQTEMRAVTWPSWKQVRGTTIVVIVAVFAFSFYFAIVDLVLGRAIQRVFDSLTK
jgi:preprotein translocase subunit SecE